MVNNIIDGRDGRFCFLNVFVSRIGSSLWPSSDILMPVIMNSVPLLERAHVKSLVAFHGMIDDHAKGQCFM